jgi:hypothetical protein
MRETLEIESLARNGVGQISCIKRLLTTEADTLEHCVIELEKVRRLEHGQRGTQTIECRARRGERNLLLEYQVDERRKARLATPQRWWSVNARDLRQVGIAAREDANRTPQAGFVER